ncbi:hypothetical protein [Microbispora sp. NPDC049633]|uniref:hypothetical protein n=1 Tax=Microbispora sp. NPDC049633 TaxID=3154355 RepID=UPI003433AEE3
MRLTRALACPVAALTLVAALLPGAAPAAARPALSYGLLTTADLPRGYVAFRPAYQPYARASRPRCAALLDELDFSRPRRKGVEYASAAFTKGQFGPWITETLRRYPSANAAKKDLDGALKTLSGCSSFRISYSGKKAAEITVTIQPIAMPKVGGQSRAVWITVTDGSWAHGEVLVLARTGDVMMILGQLAFKPPSPQTADRIAARAAQKMGAVAD